MSPSSSEPLPSSGGCISITKLDKSLRIDGSVLRRLLLRPEVADNPIAIISITGRMRGGKSFLLNYFVRYFRRRGWQDANWIGKGEDGVNATDINWAAGTERCTKGLMVFRECFEVPVGEDRKIIVLLMDTQGLFDHHTPEHDNKALLTLSTMASSVQIFNTKEHINTQDLGYLKTCMDFALATAEAEQTGGYLKLQRLIFLVRDFPDDESETCYTMENGENYLSRILNSNDGGDENVAIRKRIKESFEDVRCFLFDHPGLRATKGKFSGKNKDLEPQFLQQVKNFVEEIASPEKLVAKAAKGKNVTGRELLNMITACDEIFAKKLFEATNVLQANERAYYAAAYEEAIHQYTKMMMSYVETERSVSEKNLVIRHKENMQMALRNYDSALTTGDGKHRKQYRDHLEKECNERLRFMIEKINVEQKSRQLKGTEITLKGLKEYEEEMQARISENSEEFERAHDKIFQEVCKKYGKTTDVRDLQNRLKSCYEQLYRENRKQHEEHVKAVQEKKRLDIEELVFTTLNRTCNKKWRAELDQYRDDEDLDAIFYDIRDGLDQEYWKKSLTDVEMKYKKVMDAGVSEILTKAEEEMKKAKEASGPRAGRRRWIAKERRETPPNELIYKEKVEEVVNAFAQDLTEMQDEGVSIESFEKNGATLAKRHRREFFKFCNEDLLYYRDLLRTDVIAHAKEKASSRNTENWELFQQGIKNTIKDSVLEQEHEFENKMADQHLRKELLEKHYDEAVKGMKKEPPRKYAKVISSSKRAKKYFEEIVNEMMSASKLKMVMKNEQNRMKRMIAGSEDVPEKKSWFKKAWGFVKAIK